MRFDIRVSNEPNRIRMFLNVGTTVTTLDDHSQFIHIRVEDHRLARLIFLTLIYASYEAAVRMDLWKGLHIFFLLWMILG